MDVTNRTALVTGAAIGTGRAIALALAAAGARVVVTDIDAEGGHETVHCVPSGRCHFRRLDMTDPADITEAIAAEQPQILVNNAGGGGHIPPHYPEASAAAWRALIDLNLIGPMHATQQALAPMRAAGGGTVVNVASTAGLGRARYASPEYGAAKAGLIRFTTALANVAGVRVNCVVPDWVATERLSPADRSADPPPVPLEAVAAATLRLVRDDTLAGRVLVLGRGSAPRLLD